MSNHSHTGSAVIELDAAELDQIDGGLLYSPRLALIGFGATIIGGGLAVAGLGTPISIAGAALAAEGAGAMAVGLTSVE